MSKRPAVVRSFLALDGQKVSYLTVETSNAATDQTVVLLHGAGVSARTWSEQLGCLGEALRVVAVDLPGHGDSDPISEVTLDGYAEVTRGVLDALATGPVVVVGHSLGGSVALMLAARYPKVVRGLVLVSSCARLPASDGTFESLLWLLPSPVRKALFFSTARKILFAPGAPMPAIRLAMEEIRTCRPETIREDTAVARAMDLEDRAKELTVPTLILCGSEDRLTPVALSEQLHELIRDAKLHVVEAAGHMLPLEAPREVNAAVLEFVRSLTKSEVPRPLPVGVERGRSFVRRLLDRVRAFRAKG